jgi:CheY-like chemotaxis protein
VSSIRRALIVDDEEAVRELIADVLVGHGYEVEMATDGDKDSNAPWKLQEERAGVEVRSAR